MINFELEERGMACEPETVYAVNRELNLAWDIIENTGANLFLTGRAGTGKTTFLKKLRETTSKRMVVLAPTGVAAINASGSTIHSFFQLPFAPFIPGKGFLTNDKKYLNVNKQKKRLISSLSLLVIDEVSMVRPDLLDSIDFILRRLRNSSRPFGGLQLLLIGDLRQLPPVVKEEEWTLLNEHYLSPYFFESHALKQAGYQTVELSMVYRQTDRFFLDILNKIRDGNADQQTLTMLNNECCCKEKDNFDEEGYIRLTTHNNRAALINNSRLASLPVQEYVYEAQTTGTFPETAYPADKELRLKEGAQVMFVKNDTGSSRRYYNGLIGKVVELSEEKVKVRVPGGEIIDVLPAEWENTRYVVDEATKQVTQENIGLFRQYPLQLAWAITIHKSQGLTFDKAIIDATYSFAPGQTYVALSRCRSLQGLRLEAPIPAHAVITDREVNGFVAYCEANTPDSSRVEQLKRFYLYSLFTALFDFEPIRRSYNDFSRYAMEYLVPVYPETGYNLDSWKLRLNKEVCDVARKFTFAFSPDSFPDLLEADGFLKSRIRKGTEYFLHLMDDFEYFIRSLPKDLENKTYSERIENSYNQLYYLTALKIKILTSLTKIDFSIPNYLNAEAKAVLELDNPSSLSGRRVSAPKPRTEKKEKKPKGYSLFETLKMYQEGKSVAEIAALRGLKESTIGDHLCQLVGQERIGIEEVVDKATYGYVKEMISQNPGMGFTELLNKINSTRETPIPSYILR